MSFAALTPDTILILKEIVLVLREILVLPLFQSGVPEAAKARLAKNVTELEDRLKRLDASTGEASSG